MKLLVILLVLLFISGCATERPIDPLSGRLSLYEDELRGIKIKYPTDWLIKNDTPSIWLTYSNNFSKGDFDSLIIGLTKLSIVDMWTLEEELNRTLRFIGNDQILNISQISFRDKPGYKILSKNDYSVTMWLFTIRDFNLYTIKFWVGEKEYNEHIKTVEFIIDSLEFI